VEHQSKASAEFSRLIDGILPREKVVQAAEAFLDSCGWRLEIDERIISIPKGTQLHVRSRAFIKADADGVFLDDHYEAVVLIGLVQRVKHAKYGILRMYFNLKGQFISEDRYNNYS
jgi:hypothetical protein